jgi:hypothetical protein
VAEAHLTRQLAKSIVDALKRAGFLVLAGGESEAVLRDLGIHIDPVLDKILPRLSRSPVMGEVTSTFGDEATDDAVEQLVEQLREALLESDGVEDIYADDRTIERMIFRSLASELSSLAEHAEELEEQAPPISVRLDTLGYVAAQAARSAEDEILRDALDRAAEAVKGELERYDAASRTAFFRPSDPDPDRRLDIEAAVEEELADLVDLGVVDLPTVTRDLALARPLDRAEQKALTPAIERLAKEQLGGGVYHGSWSFSGPSAVTLTLTPLAEPDEDVVAELTAAFASGLDQIVRGGSRPPRGDGAARAPGATAARGLMDLARAVAEAKPPSKRKPAAKAEPEAQVKTAGKRPAVAKKPAAKRPAAKKPAAKRKA